MEETTATAIARTEIEIGHSNARSAAQAPIAGNGRQELLAVVAENFEPDELARTTAFPNGDCRAGDVEFVHERARWSGSSAIRLSHPVVAGSIEDTSYRLRAHSSYLTAMSLCRIRFGCPSTAA